MESNQWQEGRKRSKNESSWRRQEQKCKKQRGEEYYSASGSLIAKKEFSVIKTCCRAKCYGKIDLQLQRKLHSDYWQLDSYEAGNVFIKSMLKRKRSSTSCANNEWTYHFPTTFEDILVCKKFICNVLTIGKGKIENIQKKIINSEDFKDKRGKHNNHVIKMTEQTKTLIHLHCQSLPHSESHYAREKTKLNYFETSDLCLHSLYESFLDFYASVTGDTDFFIDESTYAKYFNYNVNFSFKKPHTDVCDLCFTLNNTKDQTDTLNDHKQRIEKHKHLKKKMLAETNVMHCEFDYAQNLPLPKLPVNSQFWRRLLWLYIFNVHICNSGRSYMFHFLEGTLKKGANSICNFLLYVIKEELRLDIFNKIFLYSDAAGGQNRNYLDVLFFSNLAVKFQIEIQHLYPVRGHSYSICDRNFGLYGRKINKREIIETQEDYVNIIKNATNPPFILVDVSKHNVLDFESKLMADMHKELQDLKISKVVKIDYLINGHVICYYNYDDIPREFIIADHLQCDTLEDAPIAVKVGIAPEKIKDVRDLTHHLTAKSKALYEDFLQNTSIKSKSTIRKSKKLKEEKNLKTDRLSKKKL